MASAPHPARRLLVINLRVPVLKELSHVRGRPKLSRSFRGHPAQQDVALPAVGRLTVSGPLGEQAEIDSLCDPPVRIVGAARRRRRQPSGVRLPLDHVEDLVLPGVDDPLELALDTAISLSAARAATHRPAHASSSANPPSAARSPRRYPATALTARRTF